MRWGDEACKRASAKTANRCDTEGFCYLENKAILGFLYDSSKFFNDFATY
jgi:hypothetical protein